MYFGGFCDLADVLRDFGVVTPTEEEMVLASYNCDGYNGDATVIFEKGGVLYEAEGSHCSCDELAGQWSPDPITWAYLKNRLDNGGFYSLDAEAKKYLRELVEAKLRG